MRFSDRTHWEIHNNPLTELFQSKKKSGESLIHLAQSNPTAAGVKYPAGIIEAFQDEENLTYDPNPKGLLKAREMVNAYYWVKNCDVHPDNIFLTASTSEAYSFLFKLLCNPGDSVLIPRPGYPLFDYLADLDGVKLLPYRLEYNHQKGWELDTDSIQSALEENTRAIVLIHPNNPTSSYIRKKEAEWLIRFCAERDLALIVDEVFLDFVINSSRDSEESFAGCKDALCFTLSGISKILGLPQMKLGWINVSGPSGLVSAASERLELIADTFLSVNTPVQNALPKMFEALPDFQGDLKKRLAVNYSNINQIFHDTPIRVLRADGGWTAVLEMPRIVTEEEWALRLLDEENVFTYPGYFFEFEREAYLTASLILPENELMEGSHRILKLFERLK